MAQYGFGSMVKEYRNRLNISQEDLCSGICDVSTLSKIETGKRLPHRMQAIALMNKLGIPVEYYDIPLTSNELRKAQIEIEITSRIKKKNFDLNELIEEYKNIESKSDVLEKQYYLFISSFVEVNHYSSEEKINILTNAIKLTIPDFCIDYPIDTHLLTLQEIKILLEMTFQYNKIKQSKVSIILFKKLEINFEKNYCHNKDFLEIYLIILANLSMTLGYVGKINECIEYAEKGIQAARKYEMFNSLPFALYTKGFSYILLYGQENETGIVSLKKSFILLKEFDKKQQYNILKEDVIKSFGLNFWKKIENNF